MTLDTTTIPSAPSFPLIYGVQATVFPFDSVNRLEVWRAPDNGSGAANDAAAVQAAILPPGPLGGVTFIDPLPNDNANRYYKARHVDEAGNVSAFTVYSDAGVPVLVTGTGLGAMAPMAAFGALVDAPPPSTKYEMRMASTYADPDFADGMQSYIDFPATTNFMRIGQSPVAIGSSTNVNPSVITTATNHGYSTGDTVTIRGHLVNTSANGTWTITVLSNTTFSIPVLGNGNGVATGHVVRLALVITGAGLLTIFADGPATFRNQIVFGPIAGPSAPPTGSVEMYSKSGQSPSALYWQNDAGTEFVVGMRIVDRQVYTSGTPTWTKPGTAVMVMVHCWGGGGGGGSGRADATVNAAVTGGTGGGGGAYAAATFRAQDLTSTVAVTVGAGGAGGAGVATTNNGLQGVTGGRSSFGAYLQACGGGPGIGGTTSTVQSGGAGGGVLSAGGAGGSSDSIGGGPANTSEGGANGLASVSFAARPSANGGAAGGGVPGPTPQDGSIGYHGGGGGGGGGGMTTGGLQRAGADGGKSGGDNAGLMSGGGGAGGALGGGGTNNGLPGAAGANGSTEYVSGAGGGGGADGIQATFHGGAGGAGGAPGGGGGGGGGGSSVLAGGGATSGAGGAGGAGQVIVYSLG